MSPEQAGAIIYSQQKRYAEEEALLRNAIGSLSGARKASFLYDLACVLALEDKREDAIRELSEAVDSGLPARTAQGIEADSNLKELRSDARFRALVARARCQSK